MAINLSTAGIKVYYAQETTAGTMPTSVTTEITGLKSIPSLNPEPETLETTTLAETEYKTYIDGLKDTGGALAFGANLTQEFMDNWDALMEAYETAKESKLATWFYIVVPGLSKACAFTGNPSALGLPEATVSAVLETEAYITPTNAPEWVTKPTVTAA